jgi:hypothetical protein
MHPNFITILAALLLPPIALANDWRNPDAAFSIKPNFTNQTTVSWLVVDNVQRTCERESHKRGLGGFGYGVDACSFWNASTCTIVTSTQPTMHQVGHEIRHCFQGAFH